MEERYEVYVRVDDGGYITAVNSTAFLKSTDGWVKLDEGVGDKHRLAQSNYLPGPLVTEGGAWRWKLENGAVAATPDEEILAMEAANRPRQENGDSEYVTWAELETALQEGVNAV